MKVLFDAHMIGQKQTGIERYWKNLIENLSKLSGKPDIILYSNFKKSNIKPYKSFSFYTPLFKNGLYRLLFGFYEAEKKFKPDIIHVSNFSSLIKKVPVIVTVHDLCFKLHPEFFSIKSIMAFNLFFKRTLNSSKAVICISDSVKEELIKFYPEIKNKTYVIYDAADEIFRPISKKEIVNSYLEKEFNLKPPYFLVIGDIQERKNPIPIIDAFSLLKTNTPEIQLVFVGKNMMKNTIENKYSKLIKLNKLRFLGYTTDEELNYLYNGAISLIFNSFYEGFGLPILEAMACKTPVICSDIKIFREIAENSAIFVKNQTELHDALNKIYYNPSLRNKYSDLGYERSKYFSWQKTAKETMHIYNHIANKI
jgi:glycosyltransferase involved in cell wall biosynthesis